MPGQGAVRGFGKGPSMRRLIASGVMGSTMIGLCMSAMAGPPPPCVDAGSACLRRVATMYLDALKSHDGSRLPLAPAIRRTENALTNATGEAEVRESFARTHMIEAVRDPRFVVDPANGDVVVFFRIDVDVSEADAQGTTTRAGDSEYKVAVTVPKGTYTVHEAERFHVVRGYITEIEIIAHVETGKGAGSGWPVARSR